MDWLEFGHATLETLMMVGFSFFFTALFGIPLGIILFITAKGQIVQHQGIYSVLSFIVNVLRSMPFIILIVLFIPLTKWIVGTPLGVKGAIPPLIFAAVPFLARLVETALRDVNRGVIEAAQSLGATTWQIIWHVLLKEARPSLIGGLTMTAVTLVSYTAISGAVGAGGLGDLAIRYGYQRFETGIAFVAVVLLLIVVQILQVIGDKFLRQYNRK